MAERKKWSRRSSAKSRRKKRTGRRREGAWRRGRGHTEAVAAHGLVRLTVFLFFLCFRVLFVVVVVAVAAAD